MKQIDAIMELAESMVPPTKSDESPEFHLWSTKNGKWHCRVDSAHSKVFLDAVNHKSPDGALDALQNDLLNVNRTMFGRIKAMLTKWSRKEVKLSVVREDR